MRWQYSIIILMIMGYSLYGQETSMELLKRGQKRMKENHYAWSIEILHEARAKFLAENNLEYVAYTDANLGQAYERDGHRYKGYSYIQSAISQLERLGKLDAVHKLTFVVGRINRELDRYDTSIDDFKKVISMKPEDSLVVSKALNYIGINFREIGSFDSSMYYHQRAMKLDSILDHREGLGMNNANIGKIYYFKKQYDLALIHHHLAEKIQSELQDTLNLVKTLNRLGETYIAAEHPDSAIKWLMKVDQIDFRNGDELKMNRLLEEQAYTMLKTKRVQSQVDTVKQKVDQVKDGVNEVKNTLDTRTFWAVVIFVVLSFCFVIGWIVVDNRRKRAIFQLKLEQQQEEIQSKNSALNRVKGLTVTVEGCQEEAKINLESNNRDAALRNMDDANSLTKDIFEGLNS